MRAALLLLALAACDKAADRVLDAREVPRSAPVVAAAPADGPLRVLVIEEVAAAGEPDDWFEVVNASTAPVRLADFVFVDGAGKLDRARAFPTERVLEPGERYVQAVSDELVGFKLGGDESLWIYRASDHRLSDGVDWKKGASPKGGSYARGATGAFETRKTATQGAPNG